MRIDRKPPRAKAYCRPRRRRRSQNGNLGCHFLRADFWTCPLINLSSTTLATSPLNGAQRRMRTAAISVPVTSALVSIISFAIETWQPISAKHLRAEVLVRNEDIRIPGITKMYEVTLTNRVSCLPRLLGATSSMTRCRPARWWHMPFSAGMKTGNNGREAVGRRRVLARDAEYAPDENGNYTALLRMYSANSVPAGLFTSGEARWLGVQVGSSRSSRGSCS